MPYAPTQMTGPDNSWIAPAVASGGFGGNGSSVMNLVFYRDLKDAREAAETAATAFAAHTAAATPTQTDVHAIRDKQAAVNTQLIKAVKSIQDQQLIGSLLNAGNDPQAATLAAVLLVR